MIRHPSEMFIKSLMVSSHANAGDNNWVAMVIEQMQWPRPATDYMAWLRADLMSRMPNGFRTDDRYHRPSARYLRAEGIYGLFFAERAEKEASDLIMNFRVRTMVETLLLGRLPEKDIAKKVNSRLSTHIPVATIERYHHYYWKVELLRVEDWAVLFDGNYEAKENAIAIAHVGPALALHKLGFQQNVDSKSMLRIMQEALFFDLMEWKTQPLSGEKTKAMTAIARSAVMVDEQLSSSDSALKDSLKAFEQFRMKHGEHKITDVTELAPAGNYSGSGARLLDAPKEEDEEAA